MNLTFFHIMYGCNLYAARDSILIKISIKNMYYALLVNGHGIDTPGKCSPDKQIREWKYAREIVSAVYSRLKDDPNITPIIVVPEDKDISLSTRVNRINKYVAKYGASKCVMVEVHLNAAGNGKWMNARGWSIWTTKGQNISDKLANVFYNVAIHLFGIDKCRKDMSDGDPDYESNFYVIKNSNCAAVLTENFFQDNKEDVQYLLSAEGFNNIAALHAEAIKRWFDSK